MGRATAGKRPCARLFLGPFALGAGLACAPSAPRPESPPAAATAAASPPAPPAATATAEPEPTAAGAQKPPQQPACRSDDDCGYDPGNGRCGTDPRFNKQPPLVDQGLVCYCETASSACSLLRVDPAPCEGDKSCAVRLDPRPHPIRAGAEHPYAKPRACRAPRTGQASERDRYVTCERTNICTMHTRECARP
jgi:hypothetical protein